MKEKVYFRQNEYFKDKIIKMNRLVNVILILTGGLIALYAQAEENQNTYILIGGIVMLMTGLYRLSRGISDKRNNEDDPIDNQEQN